MFSKNTSNFLSKKNLAFLALIFCIVLIFSPGTYIIQWVGLYLTMFSTMSNDSIQTIGTFLSSNAKVKWWILWLYIASLFVFMVLFGWIYYDHILDFHRLSTIPYEPNFNIMHLLAPILLIFLTCNKISVSTTFLILSVFSSQNTITFMLIKTFSGYCVAFFVSFLLWFFLLKFFEKQFYTLNSKNTKIWIVLQWISSGFLFCSWLTQNIPNTIVYIPRLINLHSLILFIILGICTIGFTIYNKGGPIQDIVDKKTDISNIKATTIINSTFAIIILLMNQINKIPVATTWIFLGVLGGREMGLIKYEKNDLPLKTKFLIAQKAILKDLIYACLGIAISLIFYMISETYKL